MNNYISNNSKDDFSSNSNSKKRIGAKVFGTPVCKELGSFLDEVDVFNRSQRILDMFFAGSFNAVVSNDSEDEDF